MSMIHNLAANSLVTYMVLKSLFKELMSAKDAKTSYKQNYQKVKARMTSTAATPVTTQNTN